MVIDAIMDWWFTVCQGFISNFPTTENPGAFNLSMINDMNYFLPIGEMFGLFMIFFALGGPFLASSLIIWFFVGVLRGGATKA